MNDLTLAGCTPTPLANYLKALGVFRLLAEQKDAEIKARWQGEQFVLQTRLSREEVARFFLEEYRPTPILAPWNGGSGFYFQEEKLKDKDPDTGKKVKTGVRNQATEATRTVEKIMLSKSPRFLPYRQMIGLAKQTVLEFELTEAPKENEKANFIRFIRNTYPDDFVNWLDAALTLTTEKTEFPPLLGTGGNDGNLDFTNNFMQRLTELFDFETGKHIALASDWFDHALNAHAAPGLKNKSIGQYSPGNVGGSNAGTGFDANSSINPWDFVLMLEGALLFVTVATKRFESRPGSTLSCPFTVKPRFVASGLTFSDEDPRKQQGKRDAAEIWLPLWIIQVGIVELKALLQEGRATVGRRQVQDGFDFARAVATLGVDRGISGFQRFGFVMHNGKSFFATPLGRIETNRTPVADLINDLDHGGFLDRLRQFARKRLPSGEYVAPLSIRRTIAKLENALFALTQPGAGRPTIQRALILLGETMQILGVSRKGREAVPMLPRLSAAWVLQAADDSAEFRIALALASLSGLRTYLAPVARDKGRWQWAPESRLHVWGKGDLVRNLVRVVERRVIEAQRNPELQPFNGNARLGARLSDIQAFLDRQTDDGLIAALLHGLVWAELPDSLLPSHAGGEGTTIALPAAYAICKPCFTPPDLLKFLGRLPRDTSFILPGELPRLLAAGQAEKALPLAWKRGRIAGLGWPRGEAPHPPALDGPRLLAALAVPIQSSALLRLLPRIEEPQSV